MRENTYVQNADVVTREVAGEVILVPISGNIADMQHIFTLTPVAKFIWEQLKVPTKVVEIFRLVIETFDIDEIIAEKDCLEFLENLVAKGLIVENT